MKKKQLLLSLILTIFIFTNCEGKELCRSNLTDAQKLLIPYELGQTLSYIDNNGQIIDFIVTKNELALNKDDQDGRLDGDYYSYQRKTIELKSDANNLKILVQLFANSCYPKEHSGQLRINTNIKWKNYLSSRLAFYSKHDENAVFYTDKEIIFHENIVIKNMLFHDVLEQTGTFSLLDGVGGEFNFSKQLFYNKTYGILQINIDNENYLTLIPETSKTLSTASMSKMLVDTAPDTDGEENVNVNQDLLKSLEEESEISAIPQIDFTVYPNPSDGNFTVKVLEEIQPYILEIFSHTGNLIETIRGENQTININKTKFSKGIYYIKLTMDVKTAVRNIVMK